MPKLNHADLCRLSRGFLNSAHLADDQDRRINEWLKAEIAARATEEEGDAAFNREDARRS